MNTRKSRLAVASAVAFAMLAFSAQAAKDDEVALARTAVQQVEASPDAGKYAAAEVTAAHEALLEAEKLAKQGKSKKAAEAAYVAKRHADIASEQIARGQAEQKAVEAEAERQKVVLQAREQEAAAARAQAEAEKQSAQQKNADLEAQLRDLQAKQTDRGLVLTLGDVLFDSGQATLKPGAASTIDRLAAFLDQSPDRSVAIEGHTDSMGSDAYNLSLSENRANSVKAALVAKGVRAERIVTVGKGEGVPVAGNDNSAGRQQNRRVEIIVSNPSEVALRQ
jgi:OmpA-OmpF porin, OOP family